MSKVVDMTGSTFARLTVVARDGSTKRGQAVWACLCECGKSVRVQGADLRNGHTKSCGCLHVENAASIASKHNITHGMTDSPIYVIWRNMLARCSNPDHKSFARYGGRGITVCPEWLSFEQFYKDFGRLRPGPKHSMDRRDNDAGYHPSNVRWVLPVEQANNRRDTVFIDFMGERLSIAQWARRTGLSADAIGRRIRRGWPAEAALTYPPNPSRRFVA